MHYYLIAGEASGDLHGSNLMKELNTLDPNADFRCWGGDRMQSQGGELVKHYREMAFMGFVEVVMNLRTIFDNIDLCKRDISAHRPDGLILIDYPGFNLRIAEWASAQGIKVYYYISPQVWAWKQSRVHKLKKVVDRMFVILPFEREFYQRFNYDVDFVGHPLLDAVAECDRQKSDFGKFCDSNGLDTKPIVALLPGSRMLEIGAMLPDMLLMQNEFPEYQFVVAGAPSQHGEYYQSLVAKEVKVVERQTYELLEHASAALVTSGTATLETALFGVPQVVCYKAGAVSYHIAQRLAKVNHISLVNLVMEREVVKELVQGDFNAPNLKTELQNVLHEDGRAKITKAYRELRERLGGPGASRKTAELMLKNLRSAQ
jgi:lipid-A-disaccharide synthase